MSQAHIGLLGAVGVYLIILISMASGPFIGELPFGWVTFSTLYRLQADRSYLEAKI